MKLNINAIREVLKYIEDNIQYNDDNTRTGKQYFMKSDIINGIKPTKQYTSNDIAYAIELLILEGEKYIDFVDPVKRDVSGKLAMVKIRGLTIAGHEFVEQTRNKTIWNAVSKYAKEASFFSLKTLGAFTAQLSAAMMTDPNALNNLIEGIKNASHMIPGM